ncbi:MAG TPA: methylated-DNA--[protein]-cysteine S-methyltransferase [Gaiellaceae bacterium]|nr:methylated-DNA--[protein]-cysteine S-methyltransferase [Gaiellaceae bacterium]
MQIAPELDRRFREAAAAAGLLDAAYDLVDSPLGTLLLAATDRGVCRISYAQELEPLAAAVGPRVLRVPARLAEARRQLEEYFAGARRDFELELDLRAPAFQEQVLRELARVPYGERATYGELARRIGRPRAARAVGGALNRNPLPIVLPCHRVVGASGSLVGYAGGLERKRALLALEAA